MFNFNITPEILIAFVAALLALAFDYFPGLAKWYDAKDASAKKQIMASLLISVAVIVFVGTCLSWFVSNLTCEPKTIVTLIYALLIAVSVNQGMHAVSKPSAAFKRRMFDRG